MGRARCRFRTARKVTKVGASRSTFWQTIDRYTHEPKAPSVAGLAPEQILAHLSVVRDTQPVEAQAAADRHREALTGSLLQGIMRGLEEPTGLPENDATLFSYAMYLLVKWREPRAYTLIVRWLSLPGEAAFAIGGDTVTDEGGRFLASTCGGDLEPIKALIVNREANEYCRGQAIEALALLLRGARCRPSRWWTTFSGWRGKDWSGRPVRCGTA